MPAPRTILVALDYSPLSEAAFHRALTMAEASPFATLHVVTVGTRTGHHVELPGGVVLSPWAAFDAVRLQLQGRLQVLPLEKAQRLRAIGHVCEGAPAQAILELAFTCNAERIVLGAHSEARTDRLELGRVAREVLARASVDVHLEAPVTFGPGPLVPFDPVRWASVFACRSRRSVGGAEPRARSIQ